MESGSIALVKVKDRLQGSGHISSGKGYESDAWTYILMDEDEFLTVISARVSVLCGDEFRV